MGNHLVTGNDPLHILMRMFFCWPFSQIGLKGLDSQSVNSGMVIPSSAPGRCLLIGSFLPCRMTDGHLPTGPLLPEVQTGWCFCILCRARWSVQRKRPHFQDPDTLLAMFCSLFSVWKQGSVDKEVSSRNILCTNDLCFRDYLWKICLCPRLRAGNFNVV